MSKEFDILSAALDEAILDAKSGNKILNSETVSIEIEPLVEYSADTIKDIRKRTGLTQALFAKWIGVSTRTVEAWESGRNKPSGPSSRLLSLLQQNKLSIAY
ncbi:MAG: helix-turn-helix domain-containing protein [Anaerovibrio sp.]|jgi:putative transcriptional regulator|uniref:XRE family transcriptional regulator n=2 Tax=Anaerovibrio lipolyticus TaxID=82374 RepID=A0A0B2K4B8_9FIRM|nr:MULTISPECIES: helix-turn-helix domain-containing protein [Anaerovibrio]KHM52927.1 XRE family transcriptional regulator [Anaerovibrio lipolyticus]MBO6245103.1 helix-turn-helix domain-containing protein [Anaerovibrio sp.]SHJ12235.1 putative transcriptional regulator [Anaerovibrio lipolyticus DSM 3074]